MLAHLKIEKVRNREVLHPKHRILFPAISERNPVLPFRNAKKIKVKVFWVVQDRNDSEQLQNQIRFGQSSSFVCILGVLEY